ncbi:MFS transporter [Corynebacterium phocae]|uniref:MFS transporter n=1 Tax=Corynebacterium phocae TaxID=161895 RepID=A0A1L7D393_9CORY|nr:transcription antitermination factor NusB [Corynebacterium phocae]APT92471.1 MFS transporter [Corynebacterium phocae]KAA8725076.1 MFS transporter [Corynebacterium phocae]
MSGGFRSRSKSGEEKPAQRTKARADIDKGRRPHKDQGGRSQRPPARENHRQHQASNMIVAAGKVGVDIPRAVAFDTLLRVEQDQAYANLVLPKALTKAKLSGRDAAFATEVTYGTLRTQGVLDAVIAKCSNRSLSELSVEVLTALRLGVYQVLYTRVEPHAAVDTTVRLVEAAGHERAKGFANAIMRKVTRKPGPKWMDELRPDGEVAGIAFEHAHPAWIAESFAKTVGLSELPEALAGDSQRPIVHLVARPGEITAEELALITGCEQGKYSPYAVYMESGDPGALEPIQQKLAAVQDEGSQLVARAVAQAPVEGEDSGRWLDLCAGPGGKAALLGALARIDQAAVDAVEVSAHRAELVRRTAEGLPVKVKVADGRDPGLEPGYDRVLVDAPCSGLGALRRRPEARWRKEESDIAELVPLQFELLASALKLVRPGGVVVYSTCSPDLRETRAIVDRAVAELGAQELDAHQLVPDMGDTGRFKSVQMWPHRHGTDAMFFAALRRKDS